MRLDKLLSQSSGGSGKQQRSVAASARLIEEGRVDVDGIVVLDRSHQVLLNAEAVSLDGVIVNTIRVFDRLLLFNKPMGTVCVGAHKERSIFNVLPTAQRHAKLAFFGRLDRDTTGLMLLGTDGGVGHLLTSPDSHVSKEYWALLKSAANGGAPLADGAAATLAAGVVLGDGTVCMPATLDVQPWECAGPASAALRAPRPEASAPGSRAGVCRECGGAGHWARECPTLAEAAAEKRRLDATYAVEQVRAFNYYRFLPFRASPSHHLTCSPFYYIIIIRTISTATS